MLGLLLASCAPSSVLLVVDLVSDYAPGAEVFEIRVSLPDDGGELPPIAVDRATDLAGGVQIAALEELAPNGARRVEVTLVDARGVVVRTEPMIVRNDVDRVATFLITRDCGGVECPGDGSPSATRCLGQRCVEPGCLTGAEPECPSPECAVDADCPSPNPCVAARCVGGTCVDQAAAGVCNDNEFCDPDRGCAPAPVVLEAPGCDPAPYVEQAACEGDCGLRVRSVSASHTHTCAVDSNGGVWCWGPNDRGGLGTGDTFGRLRPAPVALPPAQSVHVGTDFTCARLETGEAWCWGDGSNGALGLGDLSSRLVPAGPVPGGPWTALSAEYEIVCGIDAAGALYCWGKNDEGDLGQGTAGGPVPTPQRVGAATWTDVAVGMGHVCGVQSDGTLHCWGRNTDGQLGQPEGAAGQERSPRAVGSETDWIRVASSQSSSCAIRADLGLWCWGESNFASLGFGGPDGTLYEPQLRPDGMDWFAVGVSVFHGCGVRGIDAWCWGRAIEGQLGISQDDPQPTPIQVLPGEPWRAVEVGRFNSFFVRMDGAVFGSGANCGRLGNGELPGATSFVELTR